MVRNARGPGFVAGVVVLLAVQFVSATLAQEAIDRVTGFARSPVHVGVWPRQKGRGQLCTFRGGVRLGRGPGLPPDLAARDPDLVNEAFRQYAIDWGIARVGRALKELDVPLTIVLNAEFPGKYPSVWKDFRAAQPNAPIIAHGMNNTTRMLPLGRGTRGAKGVHPPDTGPTCQRRWR